MSAVVIYIDAQELTLRLQRFHYGVQVEDMIVALVSICLMNGS